jgi:hypothetical protein
MQNQSIKPFHFIVLTQGKFAIVDAEDAEFVSQWKWQARWCKETKSFYASRTTMVNGKHTTISMHRVILNTPSGLQIDHESHDTLDNRRSNLRKASHAQNQHNTGKRKTNTSGYKGVNWHKRAQLFTARITVNGVRHHLGQYATAEEAGAAYEAAAIKLHGEFHLASPSIAPADSFKIRSKGDMKRTNTTGYLGVSLDKRRNRYYYQMTIAGKQKFVGYFFTAEAASAAYQEAKKLAATPQT